MGNAGSQPPPRPQVEDRAHKVVLHFLRVEAVGLVGIIAVLFVLYVLFFGASFQPSNYLGAMRARVVDLDGGSVGATVVGVTKSVGKLDWSYHNATEFSSLALVQNDVQVANVWISIVIMPNASIALRAALQSKVPGYRPQDAIALIYDETRATAAFSVLLPLVRGIVSAAQTVLATADFNATFGAQDLSVNAYVTPIAATEYNLHPNLAPVGSQVNSLGLMYSMIFSMLMFGLGGDGAVKLIGVVHPMYITLARNIFVLLGSLGIAMANAIAVLIFNGTFAEGTFGAYWAWMVLVAASFGYIGALFRCAPSAIANALTLIFIILNSASGAFALPLELGSPFYWIGYGLPLWNAGTGVRTLMFGAHNEIWLNAVVLLAWGVPCFLLSNFLSYRMYVLEAAAGKGAPTDGTASKYAGKKDDVSNDQTPMQEMKETALVVSTDALASVAAGAAPADAATADIAAGPVPSKSEGWVEEVDA